MNLWAGSCSVYPFNVKQSSCSVRRFYKASRLTLLLYSLTQPTATVTITLAQPKGHLQSGTEICLEIYTRP